jgi:type IV secretion system protein VirB10
VSVPAPDSLPAKENPEALVLRGRPRPAIRFRRGLIVGIVGAVALAVAAISWLALQPPSFHSASSALAADEPSAERPGDALAGAPNSYAQVPRLGPPLPGDLGRPILEHEQSLGEPPASTVGSTADGDPLRSAAEAERERIAAARAEARSSPVMVELASGSAGTPRPAGGQVTDAGQEQSRAGGAAPSRAGESELADGGADGELDPHGLRPAPSPWTLVAGTIIPASLVTGLDSDLPGTVIAQVTENIRDSATGRTVLIPQGARLIGRYDSALGYGQRRALLVWTRIVLPDGSSVRLDKMPAADSSGYAGVADRVDSHSWRLIKGIALSTLLGIGTELSLGGESAIVRAIRQSGEQNAADAGDRLTSRNLDVRPTVKVRPGWPVRAIVNKDLVLQPWRG